jgi:ABC-2 type transport system permease protein
MNWKTFTALLRRDAHVARRNFIPLVLQTMLQPLLFVFIFGQVMTRSGFMKPEYKAMLLPGIMAISMLTTGIWAVSMPLISEFQFTKEIEDRLLAPMKIEWLAIEKVFAGMIQSVVSGLIVLVAAWLVMGTNVGASFGNPALFVAMVFLVALLSSAGGLALGCSVGQTQIGLLFSLVLVPMIMFGCAYYPWSALKSFPVLQIAVLINPLVYASEGLRGALVPQIPHIDTWIVLAVLVVADASLILFGLNRFNRKAVL